MTDWRSSTTRSSSRETVKAAARSPSGMRINITIISRDEAGVLEMFLNVLENAGAQQDVIRGVIQPNWNRLQLSFLC